jgi:DNA-3-methyladenine glycosylase II
MSTVAPPYDTARAVRVLARRDRALAAAMARVGPCTLRVPARVDPYRHLLESIVYQQLAGRAAAAIFRRLCLQVGAGRAPGRRRLARASMASLRAAGLSTNKALAVQDLARRAARGALPRAHELPAMSDEAIVERLTAVRGVGRWTVEMLLLFGLGRPDVLPAADLGVRKGFAQVYGRELPAPQELLAAGERWRPYRSVASWYLWRVLDTPGARV